MTLTAEQVARVLVATGWEGWEIVTMGAIVAAESGRDPLAVHPVTSDDPRVNGTMDVGLAQLNTYWLGRASIPDVVHEFDMDSGRFLWDIGPLFDPVTNLHAARLMFLIERQRVGWAGGYQLWNTFRAGLHRPFFAESRRAVANL